MVVVEEGERREASSGSGNFYGLWTMALTHIPQVLSESQAITPSTLVESSPPQLLAATIHQMLSSLKPARPSSSKGPQFVSTLN